MTTLELRHTIDEELKAIEGSDEQLKAVIRFLRKLRKDAETQEQRHARQRQEMLDELRQAFRELAEVKAGRLKAQPAKDMLAELRKEMAEEEMA